MNTNSILGCVVAVLFTSCVASVKTTINKNYTALDDKQEVRVFGLTQLPPANAEKIGTVRIGDTGFTINCDSLTVTEKAKAEARKAGGNALKITEHTKPGFFGSSCHQITAMILKVGNFDDTSFVKAADSSLLDANYVYRVYRRPPGERGWRLAVNGGWSSRIAKTPDNISAAEKDYLEGLRSGSYFGADLNYFFRQYIGVGLKYNMFSASNSMKGTFQSPNGTIVSGIVSDDISIIFISPSFNFQVKSANKMNAFQMGVAIGYIQYTDEASFNSDNLKITGSNVSVSYDVGYDIGLSKHVAIGAGVSFVIGTLTAIEVTQGGMTQKQDLDKDSYEGLSHVNLFAGLRIR